MESYVGYIDLPQTNHTVVVYENKKVLMKAWRACLVVTLTAYLWVALTIAESTGAEKVSEVTPAMRKQEASALIEQLEKSYVFFDLKGIRRDWNDRKKDWQKRAEKLNSDEELISLIGDCIECLRDGHMGFSDLAVKLPDAEPDYFSGLYFGKTAEGDVCIVNDMTNTYPPAKCGAKVLKIDGKDALKWLDEASAKLWEHGGAFSSPQRAAMMIWRWGLKGKQNDTHKITVQQGREKHDFTARNTIKCTMYPETQPKVANLAQTSQSEVRYKKLEDDIGYIYIRGLSGATDGLVSESLGGMQGIKSLVIDISDNGGGGGYKLDSLLPYKGKIAVLISPRCFSAGETYARDLVNQCGARLFGSTTAGSSSEKSTIDLPRNLGKIIISTRSRTGIKKCIEFNGIEPDEEVLYDLDDLAKGESTLIRKAVEWLKKK